MEIKDFLLDLLTNIEPFKDVVTHVMLKKDVDHVKAAGKARDGSVSIMGKSKGEIAEFEHIACLGSLSYLRTALNSSYMKAGKLNLEYGTATNGSTEMLKAIKMSGSNRYSVYYQATDPFVNQLNRIKNPFVTLQWPVAFAINADFIKNFEEIIKVHQQSPKIKSDMDDIFTLSYVDNEIHADFGDKGHQTSVVLTDEVEVEPGTDKVNALFSISKVRSILKLVGSKNGIGFLSENALKIDTETTTVEYEFVTASKKVRK